MIDSAALTAFSLLVLRILLAAVFASSGLAHARDPEGRGESIGLPAAATFALGVVEVVAAAALVIGVAVQPAALLVMLVMVGAIYKKLFVWKTGFWGEDGGGWYHDLLYLACALVIFATDGGAWIRWTPV